MGENGWTAPAADDAPGNPGAKGQRKHERQHARWRKQQDLLRTLISVAEHVDAGTSRVEGIPARPGEALVGVARGNLHEMTTVPGKKGKPPKDEMRKVASDGVITVTTQRVVFDAPGRFEQWDLSRLAARPNFRKFPTIVDLPVPGRRRTALTVTDKARLPVFLELAFSIADRGTALTLDAYRHAFTAHQALEPRLGTKSADPGAVLPAAVAAATTTNWRLGAGCLGGVALIAAIGIGGALTHTTSTGGTPAPAATAVTAGVTTAGVTTTTTTPSGPASTTPVQAAMSPAAPTPSPSATVPSPSLTAAATTAPPTATRPRTTAPTTRPHTAPHTTATTKPAVNNAVHPGAFCSEHGAYGYTVNGVKMICSTTSTDSRYRWRRA